MADDELYSIRETADKGYVITGFSESITGDVTYNHGAFDAWTLKINETGTMEWQKSLGGSANDHGFFVHQTTDGNYILAGTSFSGDFDIVNNGSSDCWIVRLECNTITTHINTPGSGKALVIYPNPTSNSVTIDYSLTPNEDIQEFTLFDINGKQLMPVLTHQQKNKYTVNMEEFANGMYFLRIKTNKQIYSQKLILDK
ncbi:MAG: T9SS type A sorting domain-containing protein [Bacteroidetes bacterium]|nr:T9SS type A sorting domain-containing protein [Bacteroidota bacterium]